MTYYFDMDGVLANFHKEPYNYANACNRNWIANLDAFEGNVALVNHLIAKGENVYILSKCANEDAKQGKIDWLAKYIPSMDIKKVIIIVGYGKKIDYIKEDGILVDDDMRNIKQWAKANQPYYFVENKGAQIKF